MTKPDLLVFGNNAPLQFQRYSNMIPTAFDDQLTILGKLNKMLLYLNQIGELTNDMIDRWNVVYEWVMNEGLSDSVIEKLNKWLIDGTLAQLISEQVMADLTEKVNSLIAELEEMKKSLGSVWVSVTIGKYGAKGDGVTDDAPSIQKALDENELVYIPKGTYKLGSTLFVKKGTHLKAHPNAIMKRCHNDIILVNYDSNSTGFNGQSNITIEGGIYDANGQAYPDVANGMTFTHATDIILKDFTIKDTPLGHGLELTGVKQVLVDNLRFLGFLTDSDHYYVEAIQIESSGPLPPDATWTEPYIQDGTVTNNVTIQNCYFGASENLPSFPAGVAAHGCRHGMFYDKITIKNNHFSGNSYWAIRPFKFTDCIIDGNIIQDGTGGGIYIVTPSGGVSTMDMNNVPQPPEAIGGFVVTNNIIERMNGKGINLEGADGADIYDVVIKNNILKNIGGVGINFTHVHHAVIEGNVFEFITGRAIYLSSAEMVTVINNIFNHISDSGFFILTSKNLLIRDNFLNDLVYYGFNISGDVSNVSLIGNEIRNFSQKSAGGYSGILLTQPCDNIRVINNLTRTDTGYLAPKNGLNVNEGVTNLTRFGNDFRCNGTTNLYDPNSSTVTSVTDLV